MSPEVTNSTTSAGAILRQQCGIGAFQEDVLLQSILEEVASLQSQKELLACAADTQAGAEPSQIVSDALADGIKPIDLKETANAVRDAVISVEKKGKELDVLIDELARKDQEFKNLIIQAARADKTMLENRSKEYTKQDIKRIVATAADSGGLALLDSMQAIKDQIRILCTERYTIWEKCQHDVG